MALKIIAGLRVNESAIQRNMETYGPFAATERLLMAVAKAGGDRQEFHEVIREHSLAAWAKLNLGEPNPLIASLCADARVAHFVASDKARNLLNADAYVGDAPQRARAVANLARDRIAPSDPIPLVFAKP